MIKQRFAMSPSYCIFSCNAIINYIIVTCGAFIAMLLIWSSIAYLFVDLSFDLSKALAATENLIRLALYPWELDNSHHNTVN